MGTPLKETQPYLYGKCLPKYPLSYYTLTYTNHDGFPAMCIICRRDETIFIRIYKIHMSKRYMLYVAEDHYSLGALCSGSRECLALIKATPCIMRITRFENLDAIYREGATLPDWLYGTPTLVDTHTKRIMRGSIARDYLAYIAAQGRESGHPQHPSQAPPVHGNKQHGEETVADNVQSKRLTEDDISRHLKERDSLTAQLMRLHQPSSAQEHTQ